MADAFQILNQTAVQAAGSTITVPAATSWVIKSMLIANTVSNRTTAVTMWMQGSANANLILPPTTLDAGGYGTWDGSLTLATGGTIVVSCSQNNDVTLTILGDSIT